MLSYDLASVDASSSSFGSFEDGENYPAIIVGIWEAETQYREEPTRHGIAPIVLVKDEEDALIPLAGKFLRLESGFNCFGEKANFAKLMQGLLGVKCVGAELQKAVLESEFKDIKQIVGRACSARIRLKTNDKGKTYPYIEELMKTTEKRRGLSMNNIPNAPDIDPKKVFGKLITLPKPDDYVAIEQVHIVNGHNKAADDSAISEYMNKSEQGDFTL